MFSEPCANAIEINEIVIHQQISLCSKDMASVTKVPILNETAGVTLAILDAVKEWTFNKHELLHLAYSAADLIVAIWQSYKKAKVPETWLSSPLQETLQELLEILNSMLGFVEEQVSTNVFIRMICRPNYMRRINRYHERLTIAFDNFNIQSDVTTNRLLVQVLQNQDRLSKQIQHGNVRKVIAKQVTDDNFTDNGGVAGSERARTTKEVLERVTPNTGRRTPYLSSHIDKLSDESAWEEDDILPSIATLKKQRNSMHHFNLPSTSTSICDWPGTMNKSYTTATWSLASGSPSITFSNSGKSIIISHQGIGNVRGHSNFSNIRNEQSVHCYRYH